VQRADGQGELEADVLDQFVSVAAHDLRNPIAVVRASAQMVQRQITRGQTDAAQARLAAIVEQTDRLAEMLDTFLDAARIGSGRLQMRPERLDLRDVLETASTRARGHFGDLSARLVEIEVPDGCLGSWDRVRIVRAVRALISNALIYGDLSAPVRVEARRNGNRVRIAVSGGGAGPDAEESTHLFERFYRGPTAADAGQAGSGLGLFTARGIARLHGGDVRRIAGDVFEIELPLLDDGRR